MKKIVLIFSSLLLTVSFLFCQKNNLIINGDFEELNLHKFNASINGTKVDYVDADTSFLWKMSKIKEHYPVYPKEWNCNSETDIKKGGYYSNTGNSKSGFVYGAITLFQRVDEDLFFVSNIVGKIKEPLVKGERYKLSFFLRFFNGNTKANSIDIKFLKKITRWKGEVEVSYRKKKILIENKNCDLLRPDFQFKSELVDTSYQLFEMEYIAEGGEEYLYIGNLMYDIPESLICTGKQHIFKRTYQTPYCKYLIDDVVLVASNKELVVDSKLLIQKEEIPVSLSSSPKLINLDKQKVDTLIIEDTYFDTGSANINNESKQNLLKQLEKIVPEKISSIRVVGHTDNVGTFKDNIDLSLERARTVANLIVPYFKNIIIEGVGEANPLNDNKSTFERQLNRRVEIILFYKKVNE